MSTRREVDVKEIIAQVKRLCMEANYDLGEDVLKAFNDYSAAEESPAGREILEQLIENARIAAEERTPICQDTGLAVLFIELGQEVHLIGGDLNQAINEGVRQGYQEGYLRKSSCHPFTRKNLGDNTPAIIHLELVPGDKIHIKFTPKGGGSENMSRVVVMLTPAASRQGVIDYIVELVKEAGPNPCPPTVVGVGIGGTFERAACIAKKALFRPIGSKNPDPDLAQMEEEVLEKINKLGIGPQGLGGRTTSLAVHIDLVPCHIASMPLAVNIQCHAARHKEATI